MGLGLGQGGEAMVADQALCFVVSLLSGQLATAFDGLVYLAGSTCVGHLVLFWYTDIQPLVPFLGGSNAHVVRGRRRISYLYFSSVDRFVVDVRAINAVVF